MRTPTSSMLAQLDEQVGRWNLLQHPFYKDWQAGRFDRNALQIYAAQYGRHVKACPEHLQQLAARCEGETRDLVMENLAEELTHKDRIRNSGVTSHARWEPAN